MTISAEMREQVRQRAGLACEFCGVTEAHTAGALSVDHYQPVSAGGKDNLENLLYCCFRCNLYKADYWPQRDAGLRLWCPRQESSEDHFLILENGNLNAISKTGEFTIKRLRLNRPQLVAYRQVQRRTGETRRTLERYRQIVELLEKIHHQQAELMREQRDLLEEQQRLLTLLLIQGEE